MTIDRFSPTIIPKLLAIEQTQQPFAIGAQFITE
jgi:hypothetical protein